MVTKEKIKAKRTTKNKKERKPTKKEIISAKEKQERILKSIKEEQEEERLNLYIFWIKFFIGVFSLCAVGCFVMWWKTR